MHEIVGDIVEGVVVHHAAFDYCVAQQIINNLAKLVFPFFSAAGRCSLMYTLSEYLHI